VKQKRRLKSIWLTENTLFLYIFMFFVLYYSVHLKHVFGKKGWGWKKKRGDGWMTGFSFFIYPDLIWYVKHEFTVESYCGLWGCGEGVCVCVCVCVCQRCSNVNLQAMSFVSDLWWSWSLQPVLPTYIVNLVYFFSFIIFSIFSTESLTEIYIFFIKI